MKDSTLKGLLIELAEKDLVDGCSLEDHPAKIAHDRIDALQGEVLGKEIYIARIKKMCAPKSRIVDLEAENARKCECNFHQSPVGEGREREGDPCQYHEDTEYELKHLEAQLEALREENDRLIHDNRMLRENPLTTPEEQSNG